MIDIWREKMAMLNINNTGALRNSLTGHISGDEGQRKISHKFLMYGIYVALGVGRGYEPGMVGTLSSCHLPTGKNTALTNQGNEARPGAAA